MKRGGRRPRRQDGARLVFVQVGLHAELVERLDELAAVFGVPRSSLVRSLVTAGAGVATLGLAVAPDEPAAVLGWTLAAGRPPDEG